jgi:FKBP-type peptidyl-prolyl cis-trans isomerase/cyclophilin family peptidyl-prolyl cis-trans isomerase
MDNTDFDTDERGVRMIRSTILVAVLACAAAAPAEPADKEEPATTQPTLGLKPHVTLETTLGDIVLELDGEKAPISTANFLKYVDSGYYNGTIFHRVISNFMIQGGGFTPEMSKKSEGLQPPIKNEWQNGLKNLRGTIAMARTRAPDSATAQFYINVVDNGMLDQPRSGAAYAVFGKVVEGMTTVDSIRNTKVIKHPKYPGPQPVTPEEPVIIKAVKVTRDCDRMKLTQRAVEAEEKIEAERKKAAEEKARADAERIKKEKAMVEEFVQKLEAETSKKFQTTDSGLKYLVLQEGTGASPATTDTVEVHYVGTFLDGKEFDSSRSRGTPVKFPLNRVIRGWTEGVSMMKVGGKRMLICPPDLAYGPNGRPGIPPNSTLVFEVELLSIEGK